MFGRIFGRSRNGPTVTSREELGKVLIAAAAPYSSSKKFDMLLRRVALKIDIQEIERLRGDPPRYWKRYTKLFVGKVTRVQSDSDVVVTTRQAVKGLLLSTNIYYRELNETAPNSPEVRAALTLNSALTNAIRNLQQGAKHVGSFRGKDNSEFESEGGAVLAKSQDTLQHVNQLFRELVSEVEKLPEVERARVGLPMDLVPSRFRHLDNVRALPSEACIDDVVNAVNFCAVILSNVQKRLVNEVLPNVGIEARLHGMSVRSVEAMEISQRLSLMGVDQGKIKGALSILGYQVSAEEFKGYFASSVSDLRPNEATPSLPYTYPPSTPPSARQDKVVDAEFTVRPDSGSQSLLPSAGTARGGPVTYRFSDQREIIYLLRLKAPLSSPLLGYSAGGASTKMSEEVGAFKAAWARLAEEAQKPDVTKDSIRPFGKAVDSAVSRIAQFLSSKPEDQALLEPPLKIATTVTTIDTIAAGGDFAVNLVRRLNDYLRDFVGRVKQAAPNADLEISSEEQNQQ